MRFPPLTVGDRDPLSNTMFLEPRRFFIPNKTSIRLAVFAHRSREKPRDIQTNGPTDIAIIGNSSLHLMHLMQR